MNTTSAILAYGYDLGGPNAWRVQEIDGHGGLAELAWYQATTHWDFAESAATRLRNQMAGFTEEYTQSAGATGYFERVQAAQARVGVHIVTHCTGHEPRYALTTHKITVGPGHAQPLDLVLLATRQPRSDAAQRLATALAALGLTPHQDAPTWLLMAYGNC
ncbi:hypothetical protein [Embleya sp. NPDC001921]